MTSSRRVSPRKRKVLKALARAGDYGRACGFLAGSHSGNVLERLLSLELVTVRDGRAYITKLGREEIGQRST